ncbi:MAG: class I SAM-dependent methyltransferase [Ktedonobacteraceae bacterium]
MSDSQTSARNKPRQVPIQERAISVGNVVGVNGYRVNLASLKQRFGEDGYQLHETPHFLLFRREQTPSTVVIHWFPPEAIDTDIEYYFMQELQQSGILVKPQDYTDIFTVVVGSLFPHDAQKAFYLYATNTLRRYRYLLEDAREVSLTSPIIGMFATLYRRVFNLPLGESFLDAGCSFGFLPLLVAERIPAMKRIIGVDIRTDSFVTVRAIAEERQFNHIQFIQADLLAEKFDEFGHFDTVTALHVLEHFNEADMYRVLANLLKMTSRQLVIAIPYEAGKPERAYGHEQLFTPAKLEALGQWCLQQWGSGQTWYEDCAGGLLIIKRSL